MYFNAHRALNFTSCRNVVSFIRLLEYRSETKRVCAFVKALHTLTRRLRAHIISESIFVCQSRFIARPCSAHTQSLHFYHAKKTSLGCLVCLCVCVCVCVCVSGSFCQQKKTPPPLRTKPLVFFAHWLGKILRRNNCGHYFGHNVAMQMGFMGHGLAAYMCINLAILI